jgi:predicted amidohydrolase
MKGAEIILRTSTLFFENDVVYTAMANNVYSAMANIPSKSHYGGNSMVVAPSGKVIARLDKTTEGVLTSKIPIANFRKGRKLPQYSVELTQEIFSQYKEEVPTDHMDMPKEDLPQDGKEMKVLIDSISRWLN